ncbi:MAG: NUDIX hydrolase [Candidatus Eremiobacteraeota bacterium]|nr:NUDIX hydrolase [Candidatus Eremiobacteraeota bacterium]
MRLASTVMLVRDGAIGLEVLMVRRSSHSAFAPDAFVFPGGTVDPEDYAAESDAWASRIADEFRAQTPEELPATEEPVGTADARALVAAAVRELREEAAVDIAPDRLVLFSHWITPPTEPRRYNTHFFLAAGDASVTASADAFETHDAQWVAPSAALERYARGEMHLVYPTIKHLERLAGFERVADALSYARTKPILTIMPDRAPSEGFVMPEELEGAW